MSNILHRLEQFVRNEEAQPPELRVNPGFYLPWDDMAEVIAALRAVEQNAGAEGK